MKRVFSLILPVIFVFLTACTSPVFLDISIFCKEFSALFPQSKIDVQDALVEKNKDEILYCFFFPDQSDKSLMIKVTAQDGSLKIKRLTLTRFEKKDENSKSTHSEFKNFAEGLIGIMGRNKENSDEILKKLNLKDKYEIQNPMYCNTDKLRFSYFAIELGEGLIIENRALCGEEEEKPTLRKE